MSLLIKALKKAEKDNKLAVDSSLDQDIDLQLDEDTQPAPGAPGESSVHASTTGSSTAQDAADSDSTPSARVPLAFADDNHPHQPAVPALATPRHAAPSEPMEPSGATGAALDAEPAAPADTAEPVLEPMAVHQPAATSPAPATNTATSTPQAADNTPRAQPMAISQRRGTPRWLVGSLVAVVAASVLAWVGLSYLQGKATIPGYNADNRVDAQDSTLASTPEPAQPALPATEPQADNGVKPVESATPGAGDQDSTPRSTAARTSPEKQAGKPAAPRGQPAGRSTPARATSTPVSLEKSRAVTAGAANLPALPKVRFVRRDAARAGKLAALSTAYQQLRNGQLDKARAGYEQVLKQDRNLSDAWIGLASIAAQQGDTNRARQHYEQALRINPNDPVAQAGLTTLSEDRNLVGQESRLRNLAARNTNDAAVQFALGNTLAAQQRWREAQQAYFRASAADPAQPDYAFNLAVSLEQLRQPAAALPHYERALRAARDVPARFDPAVARARMDAITGATKR